MVTLGNILMSIMVVEVDWLVEVDEVEIDVLLVDIDVEVLDEVD
jgi:hypothetical protein